jgi:STE24 endopeptidase
MKNLVGLVLALFFLLFILTVFVPSSAARLDAGRYFTAEEIDRGLAYSLERRLLFWGASAAQLGVLLVLGLTGVGRRLADTVATVSRGYWLPSVLGVGAVCYLSVELLQFPFSLGRFYLARAWGMTERGVLPWLGEHLLAQGVALLLGGIALTGLYVLLRYLPRWWWLAGSVGGGVFGAGVALVLPIFIAPLFNTFTPLAQTPWAPLDPELRSLAAEAGVAVQDIYVMDASRQGAHTNAYFTGFGATRRIVLFDTLLKQHTSEEVKSILGHELGHWLHHHILKGIALGMVGSLAGLYALDRLLRRLQGRAPWQLRSLADPAGLPLILLLTYLGSWLVLPVENAVSRSFERQADQAALALAGRPAAFIEAEKRLARDNIDNVAPAPWNVWLFSTHPTSVERIDMARTWNEGLNHRDTETQRRQEKGAKD